MTQPKDKEQLKKEAREVFRKAGLDVEADETSAQVFSELLIIINKTHRSGRESMIEELEKFMWNVDEAIRFVKMGSGKKVAGSFTILEQIIEEHKSSALKKIKL